MLKKWVIVSVCAGLLLAACTSDKTNTSTPAAQDNPALQNVLPPEVARNVQNQISETLGVAAENIQITEVDKTDWPDACLGLPQADEACAEVITPGWLLMFNINGQQYRYRVDATGTIIRQEP